MTDSVTMTSFNRIVVILFFCLVGLIVLLIFLYKKLNREADGKYTIRHMVYKEGGVRDRVRGAALTLGERLGVQLWPHRGSDGEAEEMQEDEEGQVEEGDGQESDNEEDDQGEEDNVEGCGNDDNSSLEGSESGEQARLMDRPEANREREERGEVKEEKVKDGEGKGEASGGAGLLIDLKQFSGSAIWSEEQEGERKDIDVTPL